MRPEGSSPTPEGTAAAEGAAAAEVDAYERALEEALHRGGPPPADQELLVAELGLELRRRVGARRSLGQASLRERFAPAFEAWHARHPDDPLGLGLLAAFAAHPAWLTWGEAPGQPARLPLEEAFTTFLRELDLIEVSELYTLRWRSLVQALAVCPEPAFALPDALRGEPGRWFAFVGRRLFCASRRGYVEGELPELARLLMEGADPRALERARGLPAGSTQALVDKLRGLGLTPPQLGGQGAQSPRGAKA